ncbi:hypothetical protein ALC56_00786 [Trachymyrmex septentrionalis]|uniref:Uncharacterized protein n=1 Tax=Trachymyrmex septentrionalis TaxID=34720 RepID=A0A195FWI5_9HYME|nr:hypothetical protein ALC56_00786 [Trachymyrmex septentrionalis]
MQSEHFHVRKIDSRRRDGIVQRLLRHSVKFEESPRCGRETRPAGDDGRDTSSDGRGIHGLMGEKAPEAESQGEGTKYEGRRGEEKSDEEEGAERKRKAREGGRGGKESDKRGV